MRARELAQTETRKAWLKRSTSKLRLELIIQMSSAQQVRQAPGGGGQVRRMHAKLNF